MLSYPIPNITLLFHAGFFTWAKRCSTPIMAFLSTQLCKSYISKTVNKYALARKLIGRKLLSSLYLFMFVGITTHFK